MAPTSATNSPLAPPAAPNGDSVGSGTNNDALGTQTSSSVEFLGIAGANDEPPGRPGMPNRTHGYESTV